MLRYANITGVFRSLKRRFLAVGASVALTVLGVLSTPAAAQTSSGDPDLELALRYAPVMMLQAQEVPCGPGEPFDPISVDAVLNNPEVALRMSSPHHPVREWAPSSEGLADLSSAFHIDTPGLALQPGCLYETDGRRFNGDNPPTIYARVAPPREPGGQLALQYYFFWYFNQWNNLHESDWEGIQILFDADTSAEALTMSPASTAYSQHEGGETAEWGDPKIELDGTRPFVYSSARSHASYYESAVFLGRGPSTGFGCDDSSGPSRRVDPEVILLPTDVDDAEGDLAWVAFEGHWGQRGSGSYDSPTGPATKERWDDPVGWQSDLRDGSITVPGSGSAASRVVDLFCMTVGWGSTQFINFQISPWTVLTPAGALLLVAVAFISRSSWAVVPYTPVLQERRNGEIVRAAFRAVREHPRRLITPVLIILPIASIIAGAVHLLEFVPVVDDLLGLINHGDATGLSLVIGSLVTGSAGIIVASSLMTAAVSLRLAELERGDASLSAATIGQVGQRLVPLLTTLVLVVVPIALSSAIPFAFPIALWLFIRWSLVSVVVMREGLSGVAALRRSSRLVKHHTWAVGTLTISAQAVVLVGGLVLGLIVLTAVTALPLWALTGVVAGFGVLMMPVVAVCTVLLYGMTTARETATA